MAFTKFLILTAVIAASVNAKFVWQDDDWPTFPQPRMPVPPTPPFLPFAPFPPFPPFPPFGAGFGHFPNFPNFPQIPLPVVPTPGQIKNVVPGPGQVFHGTVVKSSSSYTTDKDGKPIRTGGTSIITNNNGVVKEIREGDSPPDINVPIQAPTKLKLDLPKFHHFPAFEPIGFPDFPEMEPLQFPDIPEIKPLKFPDIVMPTFKPIEPMDPEKIKNYVPKEGETFSAISSSSSTSSKTVNGKTVSDGAASVLVNDNGKTDEQHVAFHKGDKDAAGI